MTDWIAADWGSTRLRLWGMSGGTPTWRASGPGGNSLKQDAFAPALDAAIGDAIDDAAGPSVPVICCGMAGAREGWHPVPYTPVPCAPAEAATRVPGRAPGDRPVHILHGLSQSAPPDVMRGEETQIAGLLAAAPAFDGTALCPGTHSKWAQISAGEVVSFRSALTGEMFDLLSMRSVLRRPAEGAWDDDAFDAAVAEALSRPERLATALFSLRADWLLNDAPGRARLSGLLIGAEIAAVKPWWLGREVAVIGEGPLAALYVRALAAQGVPASARDAGALTLAGLTAAARTILGG